ncbi:hypothetical protein GNF10_23710 [Nostoc sp. UCD121]|uniref:hypothetical protein n=1 Tax=unclassified Nostoc TaxID=2593658 RepID=UPI000B952CAB|nr:MULTISPECIES: hypothetical protein [unclassified Nostoc]MBC1225385.1 hypothetical protein [Nostoc sp. UCD120]MBC1278890.1 hypothetical protein [Nostoc sp. UCD121]MBC1296158.1 hypothetical protein [Nostoc sp. UCD122]OYE00703.1 hypothetical protein CDG79_33745 [Nostoc sp. 'Peltigera membranacea cyanobiont' 232]
MNTTRLWRKHKTSIVFGTLIGASLVYSSGDIQRNMGAITEIKQSIAQNSKQQTILEQQLELEKQQAAIADSRYESGCLPIVATVYPHKYVTIVQGKVIFDRITLNPLPKGTVVCDANGNTGVIADRGEVEAIAFTGNRDLVATRLKRFRGGTYSQPIDSGAK